MHFPQKATGKQAQELKTELQKEVKRELKREPKREHLGECKREQAFRGHSFGGRGGAGAMPCRCLF